jgi:hypothetical protein
VAARVISIMKTLNNNSMARLGKNLISDNEKSPCTTWMFRGFEDIIVFDDNCKSTLASGYKKGYLKKIINVGLPERIREIVYIKESGYAYYIKDGEPNVLYCKNILDEFGEKNNQEYKNNTIESGPFKYDSDIVSICAADSKLYLLTVSKARTKRDDTWKVYRVETSKDIGLMPGGGNRNGLDLYTILEIPDGISIGYSDVTMLAFNYRNNHSVIYISSPEMSNIFCLQFMGGRRAVLSLLIKDYKYDEYINKKYKIYYRNDDINDKNSDHKKSDNSRIRFVAVSSGDLYDFTCEDAYDVRSIKRLDEKIKNVDGVLCVNVSADKLPYTIVNRESCCPYFSFVLLAININSAENGNEKVSRIYTLQDYKKTLLPLIGGATIQVNENNVELNMLVYDLGFIDRMVYFDDKFILLGCGSECRWYALLLPQMVERSYGDRKWMSKNDINANLNLNDPDS